MRAGTIPTAPSRSTGPERPSDGGFIFEQVPFASAHASTIAQTPSDVIAAWFGGPQEGHPEVGIWCAAGG